MSVIRSLLGAGIVGASVWCAAGRLTVAAPDSAVVRLAVPASAWWFAVPALLALLVPAWRRRPALALPALVATLPWWPVPVPAAFLIWTGPLAWMPIGLTLLFAATIGRVRTSAPPPVEASAVRPARSAVAAGVLTLVAGLGVAALVDSRTPGGDEPHYLIITQSLLRDGDLRIENNHRDRDYAAYFGGTLAPDFIQRGRDGEIYSIHAPGVSVLVLPAFRAAGYRGAQATVLALSCVTGALVWLVGWHATGRRGAAWFGWAGVVLTSTMLLQAGMVFPDGPGALAVAAALWLTLRLARAEEAVSSVALAVVGALLSGLPWLHTRFAVLAAGFGALILWEIWFGRERPRRVSALVAFSLVPAAAAVAWFTHFWLIYGTPNPAAPYGADAGARLAYVPGGVLALLFDQQFGLLPYSPVLAGALLGLVVTHRPGARRVAWTSAAVALVYAAAVATYWMWWAGVPATPARFLTAVMPVAALPLALAWSAAGARARQLLGGLLSVSLAITAVTVGVGQGSLAWNTRNAEAQWLEWLGPVVNLPRAWPSFFWKLSPDDLSTELPFLLHVTAFVGMLVVCGVLAARRAGRPSADASPPAPWLVWAALVGLMAASVLGWRLSGVTGLDPARSQLAVASLVGEGRPAWRIAPSRVGRDAGAVQTLRILGEEPGRTDVPPPLAVLTDVPPGQYDLHVAAEGGPLELEVTIGRSARAIVTAALDGPGEARVPVWLPAGARVLTVTAASDAGRRPRVEMRPVALAPATGRLAQSFERYGAFDVFFLDAAVFVESTGWWVRGGMQAEWLIAAAPGDTVLTMIVQNGGAPNDVTVAVDGVEETLALGPSEVRHVPVPLGGASPTARVRVSSPGGFRPSDVGPSEDRRYLGVWIQPGPSGR